MRLKKTIIYMVSSGYIFFSAIGGLFAGSTEIRSIMKVNKMGNYILVINYETHETWTDNLIFKAHCKFNKQEFTFTSASLDNISRGWHKAEIGIADVMRKRYGSLREYKVELYCNGILVDVKNGY